MVKNNSTSSTGTKAGIIKTHLNAKAIPKNASTETTFSKSTIANLTVTTIPLVASSSNLHADTEKETEKETVIDEKQNSKFFMFKLCVLLFVCIKMCVFVSKKECTD